MNDSIFNSYYYFLIDIVKKYKKSNSLLKKTQVNYFIDDEINDELCNVSFNANPCSFFDKKGNPVVNLRLKKNSFLKSSLDKKEYVYFDALRRFFHEAYHIIQQKRIIKSENDRQELLSLIIAHNNLHTYAPSETGNSMYHLFLFEIAAERDAFRMVKEVLRKVNSATDETILNLYNDYIGSYLKDNSENRNSTDYFIPCNIKYDSIDSIQDAFDESYNNAMNSIMPFSNDKEDFVGLNLWEDEVFKANYSVILNGVDQREFIVNSLRIKNPEAVLIYQDRLDCK